MGCGFGLGLFNGEQDDGEVEAVERVGEVLDRPVAQELITVRVRAVRVRAIRVRVRARVRVRVRVRARVS